MSKLVRAALAIRVFSACLLAAPAAIPAQDTARPEAAKPKKIWTAEDVEALRGRAPVSVVGTARAESTEPAALVATPAPADKARSAQWYRERLAPLRDEQARIDAEIAELRRFQSGSYAMTGYWPLRYAGMPLNPADEIARLERRRGEVRTRIGELEDQARRERIWPGELR